jgi:thioredoxin domain-containing protein 10
MYRALYEGKTSLVDMWAGNPILTTVIFGLPLGFLSLIFYSVCCADFMDAPEEEDGESVSHSISFLLLIFELLFPEPEPRHEKKE